MTSCIILVNKEKGITSNKVVNIVKYFVGAKKAGHLGTLDKLGQGLLPVTINGATRLFQDFLDKDKEYIATFKFGEETPSYDLETEVSRREDVNITFDQVDGILHKFIGTFDQLPPKYSAKNINGVRAYNLVQQNQDFEIKPKTITIYNLQLIDQIDQNMFKFKIHCSSGTYIRSLCRDIAQELSTCGVMYEIVRTRCGMFTLDNANSLREIENGKYNIITLDKMFNFPCLILNEHEIERVNHGVKIRINQEDGNYKVFNNSEFYGIGYIRDNELRMKIKA